MMLTSEVDGKIDSVSVNDSYNIIMRCSGNGNNVDVDSEINSDMKNC